MAAKRRILFLCTANSFRSQMAEAILRHLADTRLEALSAGAFPAGFIHPLALEAMQRLNIPVEGQVSKSWDEFKDTPVDAVITLCDAAANEACPTWPGDPILAHWSFPDPVMHSGSEEERLEFAIRVAERMRTKISRLACVDWSQPREELTRRLALLGDI